mgnify:CR=1 FL=1
MKTPSIHLNGTSGDELLTQVCDVVHGLNQALDLMAKAAPHGRDYYVQGDDVFSQARREFDDRVKRIRSVLKEYEEIAMAVSDRRDERLTRL